MSLSPREIREIGSEGSPTSLFSSFQQKLHINVIQTDLVKLSGSQDKEKKRHECRKDTCNEKQW